MKNTKPIDRVKHATIAVVVALVLLGARHGAHGADPKGEGAKEAAAEAAGEHVDRDSLLGFAMKKGFESANPHADLTCDTCHRETPEKGNSHQAILSSLQQKPSDLCSSCHGDYLNIHPSDKTPSMSTPPELPLDAEGHITCTTCHNMHLASSQFYLLRGYGDEEGNRFEGRRDLCFECHGESFYLKNPHKAHRGESRCAYCHLETPDAQATAATVKFRVNVLQMCNFCHDVQRKFHPLNVDSEIVIPEDLPHAADGSVHCGTCHNPHGVESTVHFLREGYVRAIQGPRKKPHGNDADCGACHVGKMQAGRKPKLRYSGEIVILCNSCHGATGDLHPVGITIPNTLRRPTEVPLDEDDEITCLTCHEVRCTPGEESKFSVGSSLVKMRFFDRNQSDNTLCFFCHSKEKWSGFSPHMEIDIRKTDYDPRDCRFCHDIDPSRGADNSESVSFLPNPRMLCLRCHPERPHPAGFDHLVRPKAVKVPKEFPLDRDGTIVCTTCHDPHSAVASDSRKRDVGDELCLRCHRK